MAKQESFALELRSSAVPARLFALLADAPSWPDWFRPARRVEWVDGRVGGVRRVVIGPVAVREAILEEQAPAHHAYRICSVVPVRDHRADVWFLDQGDGSRIRWTTSFTPRVPGTGRLLRWALRLGVERLARALIVAGEASRSRT